MEMGQPWAANLIHKNCSYDQSGENNPNYGKMIPDHVRTKLAIAATGREHDKPTLDKMSKAKIGDKNPNASETIHKFYHRDYGEITCKRTYIKEKFGVSIKPLFYSKPQKMCKGWTLAQ